MMKSETIIKNIECMRRDAESKDRDNLPGIGMLRSWLRRLHMDVVFEGDLQEASQDEIARQLEEYPRGHSKEFKKR